jgi:hypothetical protein
VKNKTYFDDIVVSIVPDSGIVEVVEHLPRVICLVKFYQNRPLTVKRPRVYVLSYNKTYKVKLVYFLNNLRHNSLLKIILHKTILFVMSV